MRILIDGQTLSTPELKRGIGVTLREIAGRLIDDDPLNEWFIAVRRESDVRHLKPSIRERLQVIEIESPLHLLDDVQKTADYTAALQRAIDRHAIDLFWHPNPLMLNVVLPAELSQVRVVATIYDLIPLVMRETYLDAWPREQREEYLRRLERLPEWADRLVFISESARDDFARHDGRSAERSSVVPLAVDHTRFQPRITPRDTAAAPYVLMMGGFDPRKNMERALEGFARLVHGFDERHAALKFFVVCAVTDEARERFEREAARLQVADRLVLTGHAPDDALADLYRRAEVLFFPSRYEGFGLPVVEAMGCGTPVVTTRVASLPEVAGEIPFYCSTDDPVDMARALDEALREGADDLARRAAAIERARALTWSATAASYGEIFHETHGRAVRALVPTRPRVAYVSPWAPQQTGIADYSRDLTAELMQHADVDLFLETPDEAEGCLGLKVHALATLEARRGDYDGVLYHIGNNTTFHREIYRTAWRRPGIVVLHDYNIHPFLKDAFKEGPESDHYYDALWQSHGVAREDCARAENNLFNYPMCQALASRSEATIVHNRWARRQLAEIDNVFVIPHGGRLRAGKTPETRIRQLRARLGLDPEKFTVSTVGFVNRLKRIPSMLEAVRVVLDRGYPLQFVIGGKLADPTLGVEELIASLGLEGHVILSGYLDEEEFGALYELSDVIVNLRCPSMGESSGTLMRSFGYAKPTIVSNYQQFAEIPDSVCWKADVDEMEVPQLAAYLEHLLRNPDVRRQLGQNAAEYVERFASYRFAAERYVEVICEAAAARRRGAARMGRAA